MFRDEDVKAAERILSALDEDDPLPPATPPVWIGEAPSEPVIEGRSKSEEQIIGKALDNLDRRRNGSIVGLPWPIEWPGLSRTLGPIEPGALIVIGSRPSVGKTMFGLHLLRSLAAKGLRVLYVTKELSTTRLVWRHMAAYGADMYRLRSGEVVQSDIDAITNYQHEARSWKTFYDETSQTIEDIKIEVILRQPDIVIVDYLQRLAYNTEKEYAAITRIVNELQDLTLATNLPIVCLSQLSRPEKGKENRAPEMSDTRGSGAVEERAAVLVALHRHWEMETEERYGKEVKVAVKPTDEGWFIVRKNADGESGKFIPVIFNGPRMRITERL
jgi:replicative DNA helicase